jgi:hypothetical protein
MYWKGVLDTLKPDVIIFRIEPHHGWDYALYALAIVLDIKTIVLHRSTIPGYVAPMRTFEEGCHLIRDCYEDYLSRSDEIKVSLSDRTHKYLEDLRGPYKLPYHFKHKVGSYKNNAEMGPVLNTYKKIGIDILRGIKHRKTMPGYLQQRLNKNLGELKRRKLKARYEALCKTVDLTKKYIYLAIQSEPERQAVPCGGIFGNQYLAVDLLSKVIPKGWMIYVKEHPSVFRTYHMPERARGEDYYDYLSSYPNVELASLAMSSFDLIDNAQASATVSGTVGWESVVRSKPALLFGYAWYRNCEGVFYTNSMDGLEKAMDKILSGYTPAQSKVDLFAYAVEQTFVKGYIDRAFADLGHVTYEENVRNLSDLCSNFYNSLV